MADGEIVEVNLKSKEGKLGYRIKRFELMFANVTDSIKSVVKIYNTNPFVTTGTPDGLINFEDQNLIAAGILSGKADQTQYPEDMVTVFDQETFNQNIFITHSEIAGNQPINVYLDLEQFTLNENEATYATLTSLRSRYEGTTAAGPS